MDKIQKKTLIVGLVFVVILNLFVIGWLISDLLGEKEDTNGTVSSTEEITTEEPTIEEITTEEPTTEVPTTEEPTTEEPTTEEPTTEEPTTEEPTTEAVVIEPGNIHLEETVVDNGGIIQAIEVDKTLLADLDGDGVQEKITLRLENKPLNNNYKAYTLHFQIGDLYYSAASGFGELIDMYAQSINENSFSLVDLDTSDNYKEIAVSTDDFEQYVHYLRYQDGKILPLGVISGWRTGIPLISGDGTVSARVRYDVLQTSFITKTWKLMNPNHFHASLEEVIPEYYEFELRPAENKLTLLKEMTFYAELNGNRDNLITLPAGTKIDIARYYPEGGWIQILYEQDTKAVWWRQIEDSLILPMHIFEYPSLSEYIAGLSLAG